MYVRTLLVTTTRDTMMSSQFGATMTPPPWAPPSKANDNTDTLDFTSCGGTLHELEDGHVPELFHEQSTIRVV